MFKKNRWHIISVMKETLDFLSVKEEEYDIYTENGSGDMASYKLVFRRPVKLSTDRYNELLYLLWKLNSKFATAIIEGQNNNVMCENCCDRKIYIDREVSGDSVYIKGILFVET
jgi:hypothetical protein